MVAGGTRTLILGMMRRVVYHCATSLGENEKVGNLDLDKSHMGICSQDLDLDKSRIGLFNNSLFEVRNVEIDKSIQFDANSQ